jgi:hypothetical protein
MHNTANNDPYCTPPIDFDHVWLLPQTSVTVQLARFITGLLHLTTLPVYAVLSLLMTWPLAAQLGRQIPVDVGSDVWAHEWTFWWLKEALGAGQTPYLSPLLFHPSGVDLTSHNIAWLNFALWWPLQALWGSNAAFSLIYLVFFTLNAFAMYLFVYEQVQSWVAAWLAGLVFGFWPYTLSQAGHPNMIALFGLPLGLLFLRRALNGGRYRPALLAGLLFALIGIARWQLLVPAAYLVGIFVLVHLTKRNHWTRFTIKQLALTGVTMLVCMAPLAWAPVMAHLTRPAAADLLLYEPQNASDLVSYFLPHGALWLWSPVASHLPKALQFQQQEITFIGYTALLLVIIALWGSWRKALPWLLMALVLLLLALGPVITIAHHPLPALVTPYQWLEDWFITRLMRRPDRFNSFLGFPIAMLVALAVVFLQKRLAHRHFTPWLLALTLGVVGEYSQAPYSLGMTPTPVWHRALAAEPGDFAILDIPISPYYADKHYMHYQIQHGKPMVGGHISRRPRALLDFLEGSIFTQDMLHHRVMDPAVRNVSQQLRYLAAADVRYLVINKRFATAEQIAAWKSWLVVSPRHEDESVAVYATTLTAGIDYTVAQPLTAAIGLIHASVSPPQAQQGDWMTVDVGWAARAVPEGDYTACLQLLAAGTVVQPPMCAPISADWPTTQWQAGEVVRDQYRFQISPHQPTGDYQLRLALQNGNGQSVGQPASLGPLPVTPLPRVFTAPHPQTTTNLRLGEAIVLLGYDLRVTESVQLTLYWQAQQAIERSYKVFVHLVDPATNTIVAQSDAAPRQWAYPMTWWQAGEVVTETIELPLDTTTTGARLLRLGLYDEETGVRLQMQDPNGIAVPDNAFVITFGQPVR